jgi:hypothetical protein
MPTSTSVQPVHALAVHVYDILERSELCFGHIFAVFHLKRRFGSRMGCPARSQLDRDRLLKHDINMSSRRTSRSLHDLK